MSPAVAFCYTVTSEGGLAIVHLPVPELVAEAIEMGDSQPMKGRPMKSEALPGPLRGAASPVFIM